MLGYTDTMLLITAGATLGRVLDHVYYAATLERTTAGETVLRVQGSRFTAPEEDYTLGFIRDGFAYYRRQFEVSHAFWEDTMSLTVHETIVRPV